MRLTVIGSINYDLVSSAKRIPEGGETVIANGFDTHFGGKGLNQAIASRRLSPDSVKVEMVGVVGDDQFGHELVERLCQEKIDTARIRVTGERTGVATILVDSSGENRILVYPGANAKVLPGIIDDEIFRESDFLILQNEIPLETTKYVMKKAGSVGVKVVYNPSPVLESCSCAEIFSGATYLIVNEIEAAALLGLDPISSSDKALDAARALTELGPKTVVLTLGKQGSVYYASELENGFVRALNVENIVDTTGAGDTFLGGFVSGQGLGKSLHESVEFATKAAAIAVTRKGAESSIPYLVEIQ